MITETGVVNLVGDFDFSNRADVRSVLETLAPPVRINLASTGFLDAAMLGELARLAKRVSPHRPRLVATPEQIRRILDLASFDRIIDY